MELIQEACARTVSQTGQPSFQYAEGILGAWKRQKVCTLEDVKRLDQQHRSSQKSFSAGRVRKPQTANRFNNFHQRGVRLQPAGKTAAGKAAERVKKGYSHVSYKLTVRRGACACIRKNSCGISGSRTSGSGRPLRNFRGLRRLTGRWRL